MISKIKPQINKILEKVIGPISKNWNPNVITFLSVPISLVPMFLFANEMFMLGALSLLLYALDALDGTVARVHGKSSQFGGYLDAVCDRLADGLIYLGLGLSGVIQIELCFLALIGGFMVSYSKAKGEVVIGIDQPGTNSLSIGFAERSERLVIIFISTFVYEFITRQFFGFNIIEIALVILVVLTTITTLMRMRRVFVLGKRS